jgi:hypothetical protein
MRRQLLRGTAFLFTGVALLLAADFWETKDPATWSASEIERILTDSPWAQAADVSFVGDRSSPIGGGSRDRGSTFPGQGRRRSQRGGGISLPDGGWGTPFTTAGLQSPGMGSFPVVVRWSSARPVRRALQQVGAEHIEERPDLLEDYYIVSLTHVPAGMARLSDTPERLRTAARLTPRGRATVLADRIEVRPQPGTPGIDLYFPRSLRLTSADRNVVFELAADNYLVSAKFKPREMVYRGEFGL